MWCRAPCLLSRLWRAWYWRITCYVSGWPACKPPSAGTGIRPCPHFFSASRFPDALQPFIQALPLTAVNDALRANMLQGANLASVAGEMGIALAWLVVCFAIALKLFRWR